MTRTKVLVVDDSALMRRIIVDMLEANPGLSVVATARNGQEALEKVQELKPDVVTLDVEMPVMNGLVALQKIMKANPLPVVMLSSLTQAGTAITIKALQLGAIDFVPKPSGEISLDITKVKEELVKKVKMAAKVKAIKNIPNCLEASKKSFGEKSVLLKEFSNKLVLIGTSTGGPKALSVIFSQLPANLPAPVLVVQHMPPGFTKSLAERLNQISPLRVKEAVNGEPALAGSAYIAPGDYHMMVEAEYPGKKPLLKLTKDPLVNGHRPSVDVLMKSAARAGCWQLLGVILTGMGCDGSEGMKEIKASKGINIAEDESTAVVYGMPKTAVEAGVVDSVVPLASIASKIVEIIQNLGN